MSVDQGNGFNPQHSFGKVILLKQDCIARGARPAMYAVAHCLFRPMSLLPGRVHDSCAIDQLNYYF